MEMCRRHLCFRKCTTPEGICKLNVTQKPQGNSWEFSTPDSILPNGSYCGDLGSEAHLRVLATDFRWLFLAFFIKKFALIAKGAILTLSQADFWSVDLQNTTI